MAEGGAPVTPISKAGVPFPAGTVADPINVAGGTGGGAATIADGADVTQGAIADAAVAAGAAGSISAKLRRLTTDLNTANTKLNGGLPAALAANGGLKIEGVAGGVAVPISGTVTTGGLTDTQLRATAVPISGTVTATGPLTDTQLRATAVPVSGTVTANLGTIGGAATETTLLAQSAKLPASVGAKAANASLSVSNSFMTAAALSDGAIGTTAESVTVANTVQLVEVFNLSAFVVWGSWTGTAIAGATGSFPIPPLTSNVAGFYSSPPGASGTLSLIAVGGTAAVTINGWS